MISFYDVDVDYLKYLKGIDKQIPDFEYDKNSKFVCGIVLEINGYKYYAPISHMNRQQKTNMLIYNKGIAISSIRFSFMFPAPEEVIVRKNFKKISEKDKKYADLLSKEYAYCSANENKIRQMAKNVYLMGVDKNNPLNKNCCDFKKLEKACDEYKRSDN